MNAFHSNWTKPFFSNNSHKAYGAEDFDLLTTILSALEWRKHNGGIQMITDERGAEYYKKLGLEHIWDLGISARLDEYVGPDIPPLPFWAAGKIFALRRQSAPCVMIDTDFIVWKPIVTGLREAKLAVIHREPINNEIYPGKTFFDMKNGYRFSDAWDWSVLPCNTAFLYTADEEFKEYYTGESIRFMKNLRDKKDIIAEMVFAEQRLLAMCAQEKNVPITSLLNPRELDNQGSFTHIWGYKSTLAANKNARRNFCRKCISRIIHEFPAEKENLEKINILKSYFSDDINISGIKEGS